MVKVTFTHLFVVFQGFKGILNMLNYSRIKTLELYERIFYLGLLFIYCIGALKSNLYRIGSRRRRPLAGAPLTPLAR